jgi:hypothetical protein
LKTAHRDLLRVGLLFFAACMIGSKCFKGFFLEKNFLALIPNSENLAISTVEAIYSLAKWGKIFRLNEE